MPRGPRLNGSMAAVGFLLLLGGSVPPVRVDGTAPGRAALWGIALAPQAAPLAVDEHDPFGRPVALDPGMEITELTRLGYVLGYEGRWKLPAWVAHRERHEWYEEGAPSFARLARFLVDPDLPVALRLTHDHYARTGFDRGHMAADADMAGRSEEVHRQSYYMSNVAPQYPALNQQIWKNLESRIRDWAREYGELWVVTGPVFSRPDRVRWRHAAGLGREGGFAVPTHYYKVVIRMDGGAPRCVAFVLPNRKKPFPDNVDFAAWQESVDDVERKARLDFFRGLDDAVEDRVEAGVEPLWN